MTFLKIYRLGDPEDADAILTLSEGEHIIGRGFLNCNDKRVSRKHGIISIEKDVIVLKSVHVNPCFYKSVDNNSISLLSKDESVVLSDNDQFALLSDNFWFKVRIERGVENRETPIANSSKNLVEENLKNANTFKRANPENGNDPLIKKQRSNLQNQNNSILHTLDISVADKLLSNLESIVAEDYGEKKLSNPNEISENINPDDGDTKVSVSDDSINQALQCYHKEVGIQNATNSIELPEILDHNNVPKNLKLLSTEDNVNNPTQCNSNEIENSNFIAPNIVQDEVLQSESCVSNPNIELENSEIISNANLHKELDEAKRKGDIVESGLEGPDHESKIKKEEKMETEEKIETEENIETECKETITSNSTSNFSDHEDHISDDANSTQSRKARRDRCWYGQICYRKNPQHRLDFSHPGDDDYLTDPEDDRPNCPFGSACYRVNLEHRRQFKHSGKPATKPGGNVASTPGTSTSGTSTQTSDVKKKRKPTKTKSESESEESGSDTSKNTDTNILHRKKRKPAQKNKNLAESPDDYDHQDPFIDDGSSEEFKLSDSDSEDSDFEDSQMAEEESEETRRLIKEAKKFTKRKK